jgi:hypothetical protein
MYREKTHTQLAREFSGPALANHQEAWWVVTRFLEGN